MTLMLAIFSAIALASMVVPQPAQAKYGATSTYVSRPYYDNVDAAEATLDFPEDMEYAGDGAFIVADTHNHAIRKIVSGGNATTVAGGQYGHKDGSAGDAKFAFPEGIGLDGDTIYVADTENGAIRKISDGSVSTIVEDLDEPTDVAVYGSYVYILEAGKNRLVRTNLSGGSARTLTSSLDEPQRITIVDGGEYALISNAGEYEVVRIDLSSGSFTTLAGTGSGGLDDGTLNNATLRRPRGTYITDDNTIYIADGSSTKGYIRRVELTNDDGIYGSDFSGNVETLAMSAGELGELISLGAVYVRDNALITLSTGTSAIYQFELDELPRNNEDLLTVHHLAGANRFNVRDEKPYLVGQPKFMQLSENKNWIYFSENNRIRKLRKAARKRDRRIEDVAGSVVDNYNVNDNRTYYGEDARFSDIPSFAISPNGEKLYVVDRNNNRIRQVMVDTGAVTYLTGAGITNADGSESNGNANGHACKNELDTGVSGCAYFNRPTGSALSPNGKFLYVADSGNNVIKRVKVRGKNKGKVVTIAGSGSAGFADGVGTAAKFNAPFGLAINKKGTQLFVADRDNHRIRKIRLSDKSVTTVAGTGDLGYLEAKAELAQFSYPEWVHWNKKKLYISSVGSNRIRVLDLENDVTKLVAGSGTRGYKNAGRKKAQFDNPRGMLVIGKKLLVAELRNDTIRAIDINGEAPFAEAAPTITRVVNNDIRKVWFGSTASIAIEGTNFRHGMTTKIGSHDAVQTYVNSETSATIVLPVSSMSPGYYDMRVENTDGQKYTITRGLTLRQDWEDPTTHYTVE